MFHRFEKSITFKMASSAIHEALAPISWLAGRWSTKDGQGTYPNIPDFKYHEDVEFTCIGKYFSFLKSISHKGILTKHQVKQVLTRDV